MGEVKITLRGWREADVGQAELMTEGIEDAPTCTALAELFAGVLGLEVKPAALLQETGFALPPRAVEFLVEVLNKRAGPAGEVMVEAAGGAVAGVVFGYTEESRLTNDLANFISREFPGEWGQGEPAGDVVKRLLLQAKKPPLLCAVNPDPLPPEKQAEMLMALEQFRTGDVFVAPPETKITPMSRGFACSVPGCTWHHRLMEGWTVAAEAAYCPEHSGERNPDAPATS